MIALEREGKLFASGPLGDPVAGRWHDDRARRRRWTKRSEIALNDPFVIHGIRTFKIEPWTVMEGSLSVTVNFSDQTATIS